jgi:tetratricopeptide (TPR) repeat protein
VDARETWQALQARLTNARAAFDAGDRTRALDEVNAALTIDPNFLAAHALRDRIIATPVGVAPSAPAPASAPDSPPAPAASAAPPPAPPPGAFVSEGYAKFEQRAKRRRVDRRLDAARLALETGRLKAAASALDEVIELDPNLPELPQLTAAFDDLRRKAEETHRGPRIAAVGVFAVMILGASWLHESTSLLSRPMIAAVPPLATLAPIEPIVLDLVAAATASELDRVVEPIAPPPAPMLAAEPAEVRAVVAPAMERMPVDILDLTPPMPPAAPAGPPAASAPRSAVHDASFDTPVDVVAAVPPPPPAPPAPVEISPDDSLLVNQTLQRYRVAYSGLDARSAQAVWPAVNQAALARAFDGLQSQSLTFDACEVRVRGELATATCQGSARYVPKIGSREPRTEPRVWNFSLQKAGGDWKIESARAER